MGSSCVDGTACNISMCDIARKHFRIDGRGLQCAGEDSAHGAGLRVRVARVAKNELELTVELNFEEASNVNCQTREDISWIFGIGVVTHEGRLRYGGSEEGWERVGEREEAEEGGWVLTKEEGMKVGRRQGGSTGWAT